MTGWLLLTVCADIPVCIFPIPFRITLFAVPVNFLLDPLHLLPLPALLPATLVRLTLV